MERVERVGATDLSIYRVYRALRERSSLLLPARGEINVQCDISVI